MNDFLLNNQVCNLLIYAYARIPDLNKKEKVQLLKCFEDFTWPFSSSDIPLKKLSGNSEQS